MFVCKSLCMRTCSRRFHTKGTYLGFRILIFKKSGSVFMLAATSEEKPQGPPVNGRKGKLSAVMVCVCCGPAVAFVSSCAA